MSILKFRDENGNVKELLALRGEKGEDTTKLLRVTVTDGYASHTPSEIKAFRDAGGFVVLNDNAFLVSVEENTAIFISYRVFNTSVESTEYVVLTDKSVMSADVIFVGNTDEALTQEGVAADAKAVGDKLAEADTAYAKKEDIFQGATNGIIRANGAYGTVVKENLYVAISEASYADIDARTSQYKPITPKRLEYAVKSVTYDKVEIDALLAALEAKIGG